MQRKFTGSSIDHVGLVIKFDNNEIYVFDASFGVNIRYIKYLLKKNLYLIII